MTTSNFVIKYFYFHHFTTCKAHGLLADYYIRRDITLVLTARILIY